MTTPANPGYPQSANLIDSERLLIGYLSLLLALHHLDERFENATNEIEALARGSESCRELSIMARSKCAPFKADTEE